MKHRRGSLAVIVLSLAVLLAKAGCTRRDETRTGAPLTPTQGHGYTPLPRPPTATFIPGKPTPLPELPG